jgi:type I restriction enzyme S subunit
MEVKAGYKQSEVGVIPEDWSAFGLADLADIRDGTHESPKYVRDGIPFVTSKNILFGHVDFSEITYISQKDAEKFDKRSKVDKGDILISMIGTVGNAALVDIDLQFSIKNVGLIKPYDSLVDGSFLIQYLNSDHFRSYLNNRLDGGIQKFVSLGMLRALTIPLPPTITEQRAIAAALSDVDALLAALDRLLAKKRAVKQAAMQQLLTGQTRLPGFGGEWEVKRLGAVGICIRGVSYQGENDLSSHDTAYTKRLLRANNVQESNVITGDIQYVNEVRVAQHQVLQQGDILICMANGSKALVGKAGFFAIEDGYLYTFGAFMGCFRTNTLEAHPRFVSYLFQSQPYRNYINVLLAGSSINNLKPSTIESLEFALPSLDEQTAIAAVLSDMDAELAALARRRAKTRDVKQAMMQELLTGRTRLV